VSDKSRTLKQNNSIHKYCAMVAEELNRQGIDMKALLKPEIEIPATPELVKTHIWKPVQNIMLDIESTTDLSTTDVDAVYQVISRHLAENHGISVAFPSHFTQGAA
jgi:hypothetical protein